MNIAQITKETNTVADLAFPVAMDALACGKTQYLHVYIFR